ncbi:MAG TPA: hypothetical protein VGA30_12315 [Actinomycetota bacterium]
MSEARLEQNRRGFARHNVVASFPDMDAARGAIGALEAAGIESSLVSLLGPRAEEAAGETDTRERDLKITEHVGKRVAAGAAAGSALGAGAGFLAGLAAFAIPGVGPVIGTGVWAATIGGAVAGGGVGGMVGGVSSVDVSDAWELTYEGVRAGRVMVGVHSDDPDVVDRAAQALEKAGGADNRRFDAGGRLQH